MLSFVLRRFSRAVLTILLVVTFVFFASRISGNTIDYMIPEGLDQAARQEMIHYFGLDQSFFTQYWKYLRSLAQGDFGLSLYERRPVSTIYAERIPNTLRLFWSAFGLSLLFGLPLGVFAALKRRSPITTGVMGLAFLGYATPNFILAIFLILTFSYYLHWLPSSGAGSWVHFIMPVLALSLALIAEVIRFTRNSVLEVLSQDYMRTAWAKGLGRWLVIVKHGLRNASIPIVTVLGLQIAGMVAKVVIVEAVFGTRGVGEHLVFSTIQRDYPVLQFGVLMIAALVITVSLLIDLLYAALDPRVKVTDS